MAKRKKASGLSGLLKSHASDETNYGTDFTDLPPGIKGGIAELIEAKIGNYQTGANEGEQFIYLAGVVRKPDVVQGVVRKMFKDGKVQIVNVEDVEVKGQRTSIMLPLCNTGEGKRAKTDDENVQNALNELRKLGGEDCTVTVEDDKTLIALLEELKDQGILFKFSTSDSTPTKEYPEPRVWENWFGAVDEDEAGLDDEEEEDPEEEEEVEEEAEEEEEGDDAEEDKIPFEELGEAADTGDDEAEARLTELAGENDLDPDEYPTWAELATALASPDLEGEVKGEEEEEEEEENSEEEADDPEKGEVYLYKPPKARKAKEIEVTAVFPGKKTCNVKQLEDGKVHKSVSWDDLKGEE